MSAKSLSRTAPRSHSLSSSCCLWSHERLPQGSAPAGSLVWCTEQLWGSQEALSGFSLWRSLVLAIWKDGSCSGTGSKMSWLHSAGKTHCCKIPGLTWIPWDGTKQMCLLRQLSYFMDNFIRLTGDQPALYNTYNSILFCPIIFIVVSKNLKVPLCHKEKLSQTSFC